MKKLTGMIAASVCGSAAVMGGFAVTQGDAAHAASNCHAYGATSAAANRAIAAACAEVNAGVKYSWDGGHAATPGPSYGAVYDEDGQYFNDTHKIGLDCSGLVRYAWYEATGVDYGPYGTSHMQQELTSHNFTQLSSDTPTEPGDVVVYNGHTVIYLGDGLVVQAEGDLEGLNVASLSSETDSVIGVFRYTGNGGTPPPPTPTPPPSGGGKYYENVWMNAPSYRSTSLASRAGTLDSGQNYFYCQTKGQEVAAQGYNNDWWLKTDDDSGNSGVWVNAIYVSTGSNNGSIPGVPTCTGGGGSPTAKIYKNVWQSASSYSSPTSMRTVGVLNAGSNYFYCQTQGAELNASGYQNDWWLKTDDDSGNSNVWVNAIFVSGGSNNGQIPGIPAC
ncbi:NlpC/P60 family protein [Rudaeicoccus suwonensis]|uniref:Cell wall-associated NlpC family hydrolase n=1 Tax=Rudaeicoccus suwonensis TaxID=657409 RepID=A0A561EC06_9MICO|nr:NlpC/P60 family protein [Rudaeicoccus suwonensis]TWE13144.1 cell wall-associated NlpC family hydrolase [Rudaeicoccus suwonensis]